MTPLQEENDLQALSEASFPTGECRLVELEAELPAEALSRQFLKEAKRLRAREILRLPAGVFPLPALGTVARVEAQRPGTVRWLAKEQGQQVLVVKEGFVWLHGLEIEPSSPGATVLSVESGTVVLDTCDIHGAIEIRGTGCTVFLRNSRITSALTGIQVGSGARLDMESTRVVGCHVGLSVAAGARVAVRSCRFEDSGRRDGTNPGTAIHIERESISISGSIFLNNEIGIHLVDVPQANIVRSRFESSETAGIMALRSNLTVAECAFRAQTQPGYPHIGTEAGTLVATNCVFDDSTTAPEHFSTGPTVHPGGNSGEEDLLSTLIATVQNLAAHRATRDGLENLLHRAHARQRRKGQGHAGTDSRHIVFESGDRTLTGGIALLLAEAFQKLGVISEARVTDAELAPLVSGQKSAETLVESAGGGVILLHAGPELESGLTRVTFETSRNRLIALANACRGRSLLIFAASRDFLRPLLGGSVECRTLFDSVVPFPVWSPAELTDAFLALCDLDGIAVTAEAAEKALMIFHLFEDRRDRRFAGLEGVRKFFDLAQRRFLERCSRERNFALPLLPADIESPLDRSLDATQLGQPAFVTICSKCRAESPWVTGLPELLVCPACGTSSPSHSGTWTGSAFYKRGSAPVAAIPAGGPRVIRRGSPVAG